ncbi:armadillo-type protein [Rhizoctonia solani]|nr:armadillo-type protein [Rhizoctonia solani]
MGCGLLGIYILLEAHGSNLSNTPWESEMRRLLGWAKTVMSEHPIDEYTKRRAIIISLGGSPVQEPPTELEPKISSFKWTETVISKDPMAVEKAQKKVDEDVKKYLAVENVDEAIMALKALVSEHRHLFVDKFVNSSMDGGNKVVVLAEKLFATARSRSAISPEGFERGLIPTSEMADDLSIDVPKTYEWLARMIYAAGLDRAKTEEMAGKISVYGEPRAPSRELLMREFEQVSST